MQPVSALYLLVLASNEHAMGAFMERHFVCFERDGGAQPVIYPCLTGVPRGSAVARTQTCHVPLAVCSSLCLGWLANGNTPIDLMGLCAVINICLVLERHS